MEKTDIDFVFSLVISILEMFMLLHLMAKWAICKNSQVHAQSINSQVYLQYSLECAV